MIKNKNNIKKYTYNTASTTTQKRNEHKKNISDVWNEQKKDRIFINTWK